MNNLVLLLMVSFLIPNNVFADLGSENLQDDNLSKTSKIQPILLRWQSSENPVDFAKNNGFLYKDDMVQVYIYLTGTEFLSLISSEFNVVSSDQKIAVAYITPEQLEEFEKMDFIEKVTLPDIAKTPPIPQLETKDENQDNPPKDNQGFFEIIIPIITVSIISIIAIVLLKKKRLKSTLLK